MENETTSQLDELRQQINGTDRELMRLFEQRMDLSRAVGEYKKKKGLPVLDRTREADVIRSRRDWMENPQYADGAQRLMECIMSISRDLQHEVVPRTNAPVSYAPILKPRVVYSGVPGCYAEEAAKQYFQDAGTITCTSSFEEVFRTLQRGEADYGVVPVENTSTGAIDDVLDLLSGSGLYIAGETVLEIHHCLLGTQDAELSDIREVYSHSQGLAQSSEFLKTLPDVRQIPYYNTAVAAKFVSEQQDKCKAAVASKHAAELYSLKVLAENINYRAGNSTRFAVIGRRLEISERADTVSIAFTLAHESGTLYRALSQFAAAGLNLLHIESRPLADKNFEYRFFVDFSGNLSEARVRDALDKVRGECISLTVLGNFEAASRKRG